MIPHHTERWRISPTKEPEENEKLNSYTLFHLRVLERLISGLLCPGCCGKDTLFIDTDNSKRKGLASYIIIKCKCGYINAEYTSPVIVDDERQDKWGSKTFDLNMRSVYAMRTCGLGHSALENVCGMMNMPQPVAKPSYTALPSPSPNLPWDGSYTALPSPSPKLYCSYKKVGDSSSNNSRKINVSCS